MAPIIAPDVVRYTVNQTIGGQVAANILDMRITDAGGTQTRDENIFNVAGDILNNWHDHILANQVDNLTATSVSWLDLDSLDGGRGERSSTSAHTWPAQGANTTSSAMPAIVSMRVDKITQGRRGSKNGRMYLTGVSEGWTGPEVTMSWEPSTVDDLNEALADFLAGIDDQLGVNERTQELVVVHTREGVYVDRSDVDSLVVNPNISSQVRRGTLR